MIWATVASCLLLFPLTLWFLLRPKRGPQRLPGPGGTRRGPHRPAQARPPAVGQSPHRRRAQFAPEPEPAPAGNPAPAIHLEPVTSGSMWAEAAPAAAEHGPPESGQWNEILADPIDGFRFEVGEEIVFCACGVGYREESLDWLEQHLERRCVHCGAEVDPAGIHWRGSPAGV